MKISSERRGESSAARGGSSAAAAAARDAADADGLPEGGLSEDAALVVAARKGDEDAFRELVERYRDRAFWIAYRRLGHAEDARDVAQEAFIRVYKALDRFDETRRFYTWLYQIVLNLTTDHLRRQGVRPAVRLDEGMPLAGSEPAPAASLEQDELVNQVHQVLMRVPEPYRTVLSLRELEGMSGPDVAEAMGVTHATLRWRLHRARQLFREEWERYEDERLRSGT